jgi:hypothetical protein
MGNELVKEVKSSIVITFKIKFKPNHTTIGESIEGIILNGKRYDKIYKGDK